MSKDLKSKVIAVILIVGSVLPCCAKNKNLKIIKPNVIVIMADDLGYNDLGFQGSKHIKTPNIDNLANSGVVFSDAHVAASVCSPSRAGFITGRYQQRFGHEANCPRGENGMDVDEYTIGQALQSLDYKTFMLGKWHLGNTEKHYPTNRGFDEFWGLREGHRWYWYNTKKSDRNGSFHTIEHNGEAVKFEGFLTDRLTDQAIRMVDSADKDPFFMFLSYTAPHGPLQAEASDLEKANNDPYVALIQNMDENIGRLLQFLEEKGLRENTIIWFLSDNGGTSFEASNFPLNGKKGTKFEGGQRVPFVLNWPKKLAPAKYNGLTSSMDIFATSYQLAGGNDLPNPLDGVDIFPYLTGNKTNSPHDNLFWRKLEGVAMRDGNWKIIKTEGFDPMLYNVADDLSERNNLASKKPKKVKDMLSQIENWEKELVMPLWGEAESHKAYRKADYIRFRDAKTPLILAPKIRPKN